VGVVIPAAGAGERLGGRRKQYRLLAGEPILVHTARVFDRHRYVTSIVLVVREDDVELVEDFCKEHRLQKVVAVVPGGETRQESVSKGLAALPADVSIVLTHDAVRPFVRADEVTGLVEEVNRSGAAAIASPVSDTLVRAEGGRAASTVPRRDLFRMLTPQGFRKGILEFAHQRAAESGETFTDEVTLVRATGQSVSLVEGNPLNIKITTKQDWTLTEWLWPAWIRQ
jgi:2-C-methyl-D-erythritol 4-phosphate cytidylyltransferase